MPRCRHLVSLKQLGNDDLRALAERACWFATPDADGHQPLAGRVVGSYFQQTSTRTRTAFASAALRLGASLIAYGPGDLQRNTGEAASDTAEVLARMLDALVVRSASDPHEVTALANQNRMAVINAMSPAEHPTQAITDLATMHDRFGRVDGLRVLYVGEGNNSAAALALALSKFRKVELCLCCPAGYEVDAATLAIARRQAEANHGSVSTVSSMADALDDADIVYTTRWQTTGTSKPDANWLRSFMPFQVNADVMRRNRRAVLMHDMPAHRGEEVTADVLDGPASIMLRQAEYKLHAAKAVLEWCLAN